MKIIPILLTCTLAMQSCAQTKESPKAYREVGGPSEGTEAILEFGNRKLNASDTLPLFKESSPKIKVSGTVYRPDGKTPAEGVILYVYHTNSDGIYPTRGNEEGWGRRHGYIRGWVKTNARGKYEFYTFRPAPYPSRRDAAHIHLIALEPNGKYYWLDSYLFEGDSLLTDRELNNKMPRGGSDGILKLSQEGSLLVGSRDIVLGKNIRNYE